MKKIHQLSPQVVSQIAAGEVIERPMYAVKELIENALDAGADSIIIHIEESGLKKIVVTDNGEGMHSEDLRESFKPHTTSKITKADELSQIKTMGFRGEALSSIAAISRLSISSRTSDSPVGTKVIINDGKLEKITPVGMPVGTTVTIDHLFYSFPARKKFLKALRTELKHVIDLVINYALCYPEIHLQLAHNKKNLLDLPKSSEPVHRIEKLLGKDIFSSLIPISLSDSYITISGYLAKPSITTRTPNKQFFYINNRAISDKGISSAVKSAYGSLLANVVSPVCLLYFSLPFEMVDVNVHPRKEYVRFVDTPLLYEAIKRAVRQSLARYDLTPSTSFEALFLGDAVGSTESYAGRLMKEKKLPWELSIKVDSASVTQLHNLYLLAASNNGFILIDQHAAHERILFEQFLTEFAKEKKNLNVFHVHKPGAFNLSLSDSLLLRENLQLFQDLGWGIEYFKGTSFVLRSLPVLFQDRNYIKLLREILEDLRVNNQVQKIDSLSQKMIAYIACRGAVKAGDRLTKNQAKELLEQLEKIPNNATCPHGRPTKISIDLRMIHRLFKR
ncbi:MAG TPA: DNA mismatch repair endonuclease MutL [Candidatus Sulfotelmatobacter sp.]|nr:DNA mismatch repair endonuclease MutL [Candidatus Sulfotelmatobacter sp.]